MIEIKLSQGAKPGTWRNAYGSKSDTRDCRNKRCSSYQDCVSPSHHSEFSTPDELLNFVEKLRELIWWKACWY